MSPESTAVAAVRTRTAGNLADFFSLTKPGIVFSILVSTITGYILALPETARFSWVTALHLLAGTAMVAGGAGALNMLLEMESDFVMERTRGRPLPDGRIAPGQAFLFGAMIASFGAVHLCLKVNMLCGFLAACSLAIYLTLYTPLKKVSPLCTVVGAVSGALPPLIGWSAGTASIDSRGMTLFAILFLWQMPHLLALGWLYRADYARAGFNMLPVPDESGQITAKMALGTALALAAAGTGPYIAGISGMGYLAGSLILGAGLTYFAVLFKREPCLRNARRLFLGTIIYLPLLLGIMIAAR